MEIIRWFTEPAWSQQVVLGDASYTIRVRYNTRDDSWYCSIIDSLDAPLILGHKIVIGTDILKGITSENRPKGILLVTPFVENTEEITRDNMGDRVQLVFAGSDEIL